MLHIRQLALISVRFCKLGGSMAPFVIGCLNEIFSGSHVDASLNRYISKVTSVIQRGPQALPVAVLTEERRANSDADLNLALPPSR